MIEGQWYSMIEFNLLLTVQYGFCVTVLFVVAGRERMLVNKPVVYIDTLVAGNDASHSPGFCAQDARIAPPFRRRKYPMSTGSSKDHFFSNRFLMIFTTSSLLTKNCIGNGATPKLFTKQTVLW